VSPKTKTTRRTPAGPSKKSVRLVVKVDPSRSQNPAKHVSNVLRKAGHDGRVEEVFPGLRSGSSAGLVSVNLSEAADPKATRAAVKALRDDEAIAYVNPPKPRRPL